MRDHPLTPMRDSNLSRVLQRQSRGSVGLVPFASVEAGAAAISAALDVAESAGHRLMIVDAVSERHLREIGAAVADRLLVTGGSGVALGLPAAWRKAGLLRGTAEPSAIDAPRGQAIVLAGMFRSEERRGGKESVR